MKDESLLDPESSAVNPDETLSREQKRSALMPFIMLSM